jgi:hypothetical protein
MSEKEPRFLVIKKASIRPSKIVFYDAFFPVGQHEHKALEKVSNETKKECRNMGVAVQIQPICNKHNFEISIKASARIKEKVTWLYELAKNKTVTTTGGKTLFSFKMNFITLTLPSLQCHDTAKITSVCLNQFLTECKEKFNLQNYVWRLEFQQNGNAHYHIATDTYIDYTSCKLIWNRCLEKLGYVARYQDKMLKLSFNDYLKQYSDGGKTPFNVLRERYGRGTATRWNSPNTVDVRAVSNAKNIAFYISKYITKKSEHTMNKIVFDREPKDSNLRLWFCSRSISRLEKIEVFMDEYDHLVDSCLKNLQEVRRYLFDYCSVWYFNAHQQANETKRCLWLLYRRYSVSTGYVPAVA